MKKYGFCIYFSALFYLSIMSVQAIPFASAEVVRVDGTVSYGSPDEEKTPLTKGAILSQGDSIVTGNLGSVDLIFSNGARLTIKGKSNLIFSKLEQRPFWKDDPDEHIEKEISKSTTILELKYGYVKGRIKGLLQDSKFRIETMVGDVAILGTTFFVGLHHDSYRRQFVLDTYNRDGIVKLDTKFSGSIDYKAGNSVTKRYESKETKTQTVNIPPEHIFSMRASTAIKEFNLPLPALPQNPLSEIFELEESDEDRPRFPDVADQVISDNGTNNDG